MDADGAGGDRRLEERLREAEDKLRRLEASIAADAVERTAQDVTERKRAEEALRASEEKYRSVVEQASDGIFVAGPDGRYLEVNAGGCKMLGYSRDEILRMTMADLVAPADKAATPLRHGELPRGRSMLTERTLVRKDGSTVTVEISATRLVDGRFLGAVRDITHRKVAEQESARLKAELERRVAERTAELEAANRELEAFAYSVSHDLRAPVRHVSAFMAMLHERIAGTVDEQSAHYVEVIEAAAQSMGAMIDHLLAFSRMGRAELVRGDVDLGRLVAAVVDELAPEAGGRAVDWAIGPLPPVFGDPALLRLAFTNLLANALKFTRVRQPARIQVGCAESSADGQIVVFVRDNGVGFDPSYTHKLFRVFQRLHRVDDFEGTGIGLANVRRIVERHGGRVWAEGVLGAGATFYLSLPRAPAA
jgi:PAS domain S-box-containing protein